MRPTSDLRHDATVFLHGMQRTIHPREQALVALIASNDENAWIMSNRGKDVDRASGGAMSTAGITPIHHSAMSWVERDRFRHLWEANFRS